MTKDSKDTEIRSLKRPEFKPTPMKFADESHPIFSNPTVITFSKNSMISTSMISTRSLEKDSTQPEEEPAKVSKIVKLLRKL